MAKLVTQKAKGADLGVLQEDVEHAAKALKAAKAALLTAKAAADRAEEVYNNAQKSLTVGVEAVKTATKVG